MSKLVYIAGPYSSEDRKQKRANIEAAINAALWCARNRIYYFCPHMNSAYFDDLAPNVPATFYHDMDIRIAWTCDGLLLLPGWEESRGALGEYSFFTQGNKPVFYWPNDLGIILKWSE